MGKYWYVFWVFFYIAEFRETQAGQWRFCFVRFTFGTGQTWTTKIYGIIMTGNVYIVNTLVVSAKRILIWESPKKNRVAQVIKSELFTALSPWDAPNTRALIFPKKEPSSSVGAVTTLARKRNINNQNGELSDVLDYFFVGRQRALFDTLTFHFVSTHKKMKPPFTIKQKIVSFVQKNPQEGKKRVRKSPTKNKIPSTNAPIPTIHVNWPTLIRISRGNNMVMQHVADWFEEPASHAARSVALKLCWMRAKMRTGSAGQTEGYIKNMIETSWEDD